MKHRKPSGGFEPKLFSTPVHSARNAKSFFQAQLVNNVENSNGNENTSTPMNKSDRTLTNGANKINKSLDRASDTIIPETQEADSVIPETQDDQNPNTQDHCVPETQEDNVPATQDDVATDPVQAQVY